MHDTLQKTTETITETKYAMPMYDENQKYLYTVLCPQQKSKIAQALVQYTNGPENAEIIFKSFLESQLSICTPVKDQLVTYLKPLFPKIDSNLYLNPKLRERALKELFDLANTTKNPVFIHGIAIIKYYSMIILKKH